MAEKKTPFEWVLDRLKNRSTAQGAEPTVQDIPGVSDVSRAQEAEDIIKKRKKEQEKALEYD
jgi:hypothetical protein